MIEQPKQAFPLQWPSGWKRTSARRRSRFGTWSNKPSIAYAISELQNELRMMGANQVIVSSNLRLKSNGLPYSDQNTMKQDPGVAVYFKRKGIDMVIPCDTFDLPGCNLYAVARTVQALRQMERDGCEEISNRAFTGFAALPETGSREAWHSVLGIDAACSYEEAKTAWRQLVSRWHPDKPRGDRQRFDAVQAAWEEAQTHFRRR